MSSILITGGSGFVGTHLLKKINPAKFGTIYCLSRKDRREFGALAEQPHVKLLRGSLSDLAQHERELAGVATVVHLAAATGKALRDDYFRVNVDGTRSLVEASRRVGVKSFLYVSSIAARFPNKSRYYYAQSKEQAEQIARSSGLRHTIIRPTIILGPGAPVWVGLARLAQLSVIPIFGDGKTLIQPISVDDLADFILALLDRDIFHDETLELGGPERISIEEFLKKAHRLLRQTKPRTVHIPLALMVPFLTLVEIPFSSLLPFTLGQLASFRYDGTIETNPLFEERAPRLKTIDGMLASIVSHGAR